jgi:hypothetical protein
MQCNTILVCRCYRFDYNKAGTQFRMLCTSSALHKTCHRLQYYKYRIIPESIMGN